MILTNIVFSQRRSAASLATFSPDGRRLAIGEDYGRTRLCDLRTGSSAVLVPDRRGVKVGRFAFSPRGNLLAVGYDQHDVNKAAICLWNVETREQGDTRSLRVIEALPAFGNNYWGLALSPDDRWLATGHAE